jgi:hypothetical protein
MKSALYKISVASAKTPKNLLKQSEGMKAFFLNTRKINLCAADKLMKIFTSHPNMKKE